MDPQDFCSFWDAEPSDLSDLTCERISTVNRWLEDSTSPNYAAPSSKVQSRLAFVHFIFLQWLSQEDLPSHLRVVYDALRSRQKRLKLSAEPLSAARLAKMKDRLARLKESAFEQYFMVAWNAERSDLSDLTGKGMDTVNRWFMSQSAHSYRPPPPEILSRLAYIHFIFMQWRSEESLPGHLRAVYELLRSRQRHRQSILLSESAADEDDLDKEPSLAEGSFVIDRDDSN